MKWKLEVDDDVEGHAQTYLESGEFEVNVRSTATGDVLKGQLRKEGSDLMFEVEEEDTQGQGLKGKFLDEGGPVTIQLDTGDEVEGHITSMTKISSPLPFGQRPKQESRVPRPIGTGGDRPERPKRDT